MSPSKNQHMIKIVRLIVAVVLGIILSIFLIPRGLNWFYGNGSFGLVSSQISAERCDRTDGTLYFWHGSTNGDWNVHFNNLKVNVKLTEIDDDPNLAQLLRRVPPKQRLRLDVPYELGIELPAEILSRLYDLDVTDFEFGNCVVAGKAVAFSFAADKPTPGDLALTGIIVHQYESGFEFDVVEMPVSLDSIPASINLSKAKITSRIRPIGSIADTFLQKHIRNLVRAKAYDFVLVQANALPQFYRWADAPWSPGSPMIVVPNVPWDYSTASAKLDLSADTLQWIEFEFPDGQATVTHYQTR